MRRKRVHGHLDHDVLTFGIYSSPSHRLFTTRHSAKLARMIPGAHVLFYSKDPEADRAFFRDILGFASVDVGHDWLIFKLPPAEAALHPQMDQNFVQRHAGHELLGAVLYLMCDDLQQTIH